MTDKKDLTTRKGEVTGNHRKVSTVHSPIGLGSYASPSTIASPIAHKEESQKNLLKMSLHFVRMQNVWGFGFWEWDLASGRFKVHPSHLWRAMGYQPELILTVKSVDQVLHFVHKEDRKRLVEEVFHRLVKSTSYEYSFRVQNRDGSYRWIQSRTSSLKDSNGRVNYIAGVNYDISTEQHAEEGLRKNQAQFQRILRSSNDGIWEWSRKDEKVTFSQGCWNLLGFNVDDETLGARRHRLWRVRIHPLDRPQFDQILLDRSNNGGEFDIEYRVQNREKSWLWVRTRGDVIYDEHGEVEFLAGANIDITELKQADERIISAKKIAENANQAKSEFLSSMSHELRTPMNAILGFTQLFDYADNILEEQRENITEIRHAGNELLELINDVLELSKIEAGKLEVTVNVIPIATVIKEVFEHCQGPATDRGVDLSYEPHHLDKVAVKSDKASLVRAIINIICFSVYNSHQDGRVIVSLMDTANKYLVISVRDTSKGISKEYQQFLFEPFSKRSYEQTESASIGVGLTISKRLVELMNGNLEFESEEGVGSCFQIHLPLGAINAVQSVQAEVKPKPLNKNPHLFSGKRLLYLDDQKESTAALERYFKGYQHMEFFSADEGVLGLYKARSSQPDAIVIDINMPGMDGYEILTILRNDPTTEDIPVIAVSEIASLEDMQRALDVGFSDYLTKPVDVEQLTMVLNGLLNLN